MGSVTKRIRRNIEENLTGFRGKGGGGGRFKSMSKFRKSKVTLKLQKKSLTPRVLPPKMNKVQTKRKEG